MTRVLVIDGHPDRDRHHFVHALADAYAQNATPHHEVKRIDISDLDFPLVRSPAAWQREDPPAAIAEAQAAIRWAEHVVILYPLWLGDVPALLKGFLEQVARPNFAFGPIVRGMPKKMLAGRSARVIVTMGMPALFYRLFYRAHSVKSLKRNILAFTGMGPIRLSLIGSVMRGDGHRTRWLARVRRLALAAY